MGTVMDSGLYELAPEPERPRRAARTCPVCLATRAAQVCDTCGVDLDTGDFVGVPELVDRPTADDVVLPPPVVPPGAAAKSREPLREYAEHRVPESVGEMLARAVRRSSAGWVSALVYLPMVTVAVSFQRIPWANEPWPWPGQMIASFVLSYCLLERARAAYDESNTFDLSELGSTLARALFLLPLLVGLGSLPLSAWPVIPVAAVTLPLVLGALATNSWDELLPKALFVAARETPYYTRDALAAAVTLGGALLAVWAVPDGNPVWRGVAAVAGASLSGAIAGSSRLDAELGDV